MQLQREPMMIVHGMKMYVLNEKLIPKRMAQHTRTANAGCPLTAFDPPQKVNKAFLAERPVMPDKWDSGQAFHAFSTHIERDIFGPELTDFVTIICLLPRLPIQLAAKASIYNKDNPSLEGDTRPVSRGLLVCACEFLDLNTLES